MLHTKMERIHLVDMRSTVLVHDGNNSKQMTITIVTNDGTIVGTVRNWQEDIMFSCSIPPFKFEQDELVQDVYNICYKYIASRPLSYFYTPS